jgi:hypothetical protein
MATSLNLGRASGLRLTALLIGVSATAASLHFAWAGIFGPLPGPAGGVRERASAVVLPNLTAEDPRPFEPVALVEQPLFSPTRTKPQPMAAPVVAEVPPPPVLAASAEQAPDPSYVIGGVVISPAFRKVLLRSEGSDRGRWMREGDSTQDGWKVSAIAADKVVVSRGSRRVTFQLRSHVSEKQRLAAR